MNRIDLYRMRGPGTAAGRDLPVEGKAAGRRHALAGQIHEAVERLREAIGGEVLFRGSASILRVYEEIPYEVSTGESANTHLLHVLCPEIMPSTALKDMLFFDVETTGLSGGAGTVVFLIGFLNVGENSLKLTQYFLNSLSSEAFFLEHVERMFGRHSCFVSYNGKSFDFNIIKNRFVMQGMPFDGEDVRHLDLLHTSRRLWRGMLPDYRLGTVEERILGMKRTGDIPGWRVPEVYSDYLRGRNVFDDMKAVFFHNRKDVLSLFAILDVQLRIMAEAGKGRSVHEPPGKVRYNPVSVSGLFAARRYTRKAVEILSAHREDVAALRSLALFYKRDGRFPESIECFERLCEKRGRLSEYIFACTEIAKIYEHRLKDLDRAVLFTERMRTRLRRALYFHPRERAYLEHELEKVDSRYTRLRRKIDTLEKKTETTGKRRGLKI